METNGIPKVEILPLKENVLADGPSTMHFLIRITGPEIQVEKNRPRLNLGLVLDRSGSMTGKKLHQAKKAACYCVDQLLPTDRISVTVFDNSIDVIVPPVQGDARSEIKARINTIEPGGTTALHAAWVKGGKQVAQCLEPECLNRVILVTDGLANVGVTDTDTIVTQAKGVYERGISTSTIGVGQDFNEDLLRPMATSAGGNSWFVEGPEDFPRIFETEMEGLLREVCSRVGLKFELEKGVEILDVLNDFSRSEDGAHALPNLLSGESLDIVVQVSLPGGTLGTSRPFGVTVDFTPRGSTERKAVPHGAAITYAPEEKVNIQEINLEVQKALQLLESARARRNAMIYMDSGDHQGASAVLASYSRSSRYYADMISDADLDADSRALDELSRQVSEKRDPSSTRKKMAYQSLYRQRGRKEKKEDQGS